MADHMNLLCQCLQKIDEASVSSTSKFSAGTKVAFASEVLSKAAVMLTVKSQSCTLNNSDTLAIVADERHFNSKQQFSDDLKYRGGVWFSS